jgi:FkbM family methyltransferase
MNKLVQHTLGRMGLELRRKIPPKADAAFQPFVQEVSLAGVSFSFWVGDPTGKLWYNPEDHQQFAEHNETARLVKPGNKVLEIGTHHGFYGMVLSKLVGDGGFVLGVEPSPFNAMMASAQIGLNRASNFKILQAAASDRSGSVHISRQSNAIITADRDTIEVPAVTVDELDARFGPFDVLKVDVEGFERQVLTGASKLLQKRPRILLELHSPDMLSAFGSTMGTVLDLLAPSYQGTFISRDERRRIYRFPAEKPRDVIVNLFLAHL